MELVTNSVDFDANDDYADGIGDIYRKSTLVALIGYSHSI